MPERIQLSRRKGWKMPPNTVKVDRTTKWGNPFVVGEHGTTEECVERFREHVGHPNSALGFDFKELHQLRGKNLACWCKPGEPCHADVLLELANDQIQRRR